MTAPSPPSQSIGSQLVHPPSGCQVRQAAGSEAVRQAKIHLCESVDQTWKRRLLARSYAWMFLGIVDSKRRNIQISKHQREVLCAVIWRNGPYLFAVKAGVLDSSANHRLWRVSSMTSSTVTSVQPISMTKAGKDTLLNSLI